MPGSSPFDTEIAPEHSQSLAAVVLCGGRSKRMGTDKANLRFGRSTLLQETCETVSSVAFPVVVVAAPKQNLPRLAPQILLERDPAEYPGPLAALLTGLRRLQKGGEGLRTGNDECVWVTGCDTPFVTATVIRTLHQKMVTKGTDAATLTFASKRNPLLACYRNPTESLANALDKGIVRATDFLDRLDVVEVRAESFMASVNEPSPAENLNEPQDVQRTRGFVTDE